MISVHKENLRDLSIDMEGSVKDPSDGVTKLQLSHILKLLLSFQRYNVL